MNFSRACNWVNTRYLTLSIKQRLAFSLTFSINSHQVLRGFPFLFSILRGLLLIFKTSSISIETALMVMDLMIHTSDFLLSPPPATIFNQNSKSGPASRTYALVILNQRLPRLTPLLWEHAQLRVCADGGANRLYDEIPHFFPYEDALAVRRKYKPDVIKGDLDSVRDDVVHFYSKIGTTIVDASNDQDTTDLHKCVLHIRDVPDLQNLNLRILVVGALGGRFDHELGNINVLYTFSTTQIILLNDDCLIQLLPCTHHHEIHINSPLEGQHCGLAPLSMPSSSTTTTGLKWNLRNSEMKFGGLVSTSNIVRGDVVTVHSDIDLIWTISIKSK